MKHIRLLLGFLISAVFLYLAFRGVHFDEVWQALRAANHLWLVPVIGAIVLSLVLRAYRWQWLFYPTRGLRFGNVFGAMNAGYLVNTVLPARLGEVVRAVLLSRLEGVRAGHALTTVAVERVLDLLTTIAVLALLLPFVPLPDDAVLPLALATGLAVGGLLVMIVAGARQDLTRRLAGIVTRRLPGVWGGRAERLLDQMLEGFAVLSRPAVAARLVGLSVVIWLVNAMAIYACLFAFHLRLSPAAPLFVLALISLSFIVPSSPGHIGVFHLAAIKALEIGFGRAAGDPDVVGFALVAHVLSFAPPTLLGAWFIWRAGLSLGSVISFGKQRSAPAAEQVPVRAAGQ